MGGPGEGWSGLGPVNVEGVPVGAVQVGGGSGGPKFSAFFCRENSKCVL